MPQFYTPNTPEQKKQHKFRRTMCTARTRKSAFFAYKTLYFSAKRTDRAAPPETPKGQLWVQIPVGGAKGVTHTVRHPFGISNRREKAYSNCGGKESEKKQVNSKGYLHALGVIL